MQNSFKETKQFDTNAFAYSHAASEYVKLFYFPVKLFDREKIAYCNMFCDFHSFFRYTIDASTVFSPFSLYIYLAVIQ
jgi:hypothetical protein